MLRKQLEADLGMSLSEKKSFLKGEIREYLARQHQEEEEEEEEEEEGEEEDEEDEDVPVARGKSKPRARFGQILSYEMSEFLGMEECPRGQVVKKLWEYIKANKLQDPKNGQRIILDDKLKTLFPGRKFVTMFGMNKLISKHVFVDDTMYGGESKPKKSVAKKATEKKNSTNKPALTGFTKPLNLSPELQAWAGCEACSRPEITKKLWAYVKENNLQDPNDKRYVISDEALHYLTGEPRFQAFSFLKLIKDHVLGYQ